MLEVKSLSRSFGGVHALKEVSFSVKKGKITALIGPNGSGKSTLFNLVSGIILADSGKVLLDSKDTTHLSVEEIARLGVSRVFQSSRLFGNMTAKENLLLSVNQTDLKFWKSFFGFGAKKENALMEEKVLAALKQVSLEEKSFSKAQDLSFGQKRLLELARAMLLPHKILLLDEPVAGVTPPTRKRIAEILSSLRAKGETILLIEHDMNFTLSLADEVIVLDEGKVIAKGRPAQVKKNKKVLEAYLGE